MFFWTYMQSILNVVAMIFLGALLLQITAKYFFKLEDKSYKTALKVTAILGAISLVISLIGISITFSLMSIALMLGTLSFIIGLLLSLYLIKTFYQLEWGKAALVWVVYFVLSLVAGLIIGAILGMIFMPLIGAEVIASV